MKWRLADLAGMPDQPPGFVPPMQCKLVTCLPVGSHWRYELKLDGYRALAIKTAAGTRLISRNQKDLSHEFPEIVQAVGKLNVCEAVIDGEIVAVDKTCKPSFQALQHAGRAKHRAVPILYFAFDLLNLEGKLTTSLALTERKRLLEQILAGASDRMRFTGFLDGEPDAIVKAIRHHNLEGVVAKWQLPSWPLRERGPGPHLRPCCQLVRIPSSSGITALRSTCSK
jgi:bifunctional non-homologous end joining protein LigD